MKANQKTLHRQIGCQFQGNRKIPFVASDYESSHGRSITWILRAKATPEHIAQDWIDTSWIVEVAASGTRDGKPFQATHLFLTTLEALLQLVRVRWSIKDWHWIRDTQLNENAHRFRGNGADVMTTLRTVALSMLRKAGFRSIPIGMQRVMHDITELLALVRRQPAPSLC